jgi:hypothetical protein
MASVSVDGGSYDPDPGDSITNKVQNPPGPYHLGTNLVMLTVTDTHGASDSCLARVVVIDTTPPTMHCPGNIVATNDPGFCSAKVSYTATATDNCGTVTNITEDFPPGSTFPKGTTTVHVTAVDNAGNPNMCSFTITVLDKEPPVVGCLPAPIPGTTNVVSGKPVGTATNSPPGYYQLLVTDNCDPNPQIYIKDTGSRNVMFGPFHNGDIVRLKHAGTTASQAPGTAPVVAVLSLKGNALNVAKDAAGNWTPDSKGCLMAVPPK